MIKKETKKRSNTKKTVKTETHKPVQVEQQFTPRRFSVRGLRRHSGIQTSRTPRVAF